MPGSDHFQPATDARSGNTVRYRLFGSMFAQALREVGVDARVGEIPGEYCPGEYSVLILGIFSSALPYGVEIIALKNLPSRTFSILMSLEPALAALSGFLFLGEQLSLAQWAALSAIISASIGSTLTIKKQ